MVQEQWLELNIKPGLVAIGTVLTHINGFGFSHDPVRPSDQRIE